jgi:hypothetical protein
MEIKVVDVLAHISNEIITADNDGLGIDIAEKGRHGR